MVTRVDRDYEGRDNHVGGGTVLGAIVGGALGNQVGKGDGRKAATIAGAVAGGAIGNNVGRRDDDTYVSSERRCREVDGGYEERRINGYDVEYRYRGETYMSRLTYDPGERIRVRVSVTPADWRPGIVKARLLAIPDSPFPIPAYVVALRKSSVQ